MPWFKVDGRYASHPAILKAGNGATGLWLRLGCWLSNYPNQVDVIPRQVALQHGSRREISRLLDAGLLVERDDGDYLLNASMAIATSNLPGRSWVIEQASVRKSIPDVLRAAVYDRDGRRCVICGATGDLTLDHIYPHSLGGSDSFDNLRTLCRPCNSRKGAKV